jgi:hypothetical protein
LAVREMQIKIALRFYPPPHTPKSEWLSWRKQQQILARKWGKGTLIQYTPEISMQVPQKTKTRTDTWSSYTTGYIPEEI